MNPIVLAIAITTTSIVLGNCIFIIGKKVASKISKDKPVVINFEKK